MSGRIYCGRLPSDAAEKDLESLLKSIGKVRDVDFKEGYAYAVFKDYHDADKAVEELNGKEFMGQSILVERAKEIRNGVGGYTAAGGYTARVRQPKPPPVRTNHRIRVENLPARAKWSELKEFMSVAGEVTFADTHRRKPGEGVVEFSNKEDMVNALETLDKHPCPLYKRRKDVPPHHRYRNQKDAGQIHVTGQSHQKEVERNIHILYHHLVQVVEDLDHARCQIISQHRIHGEKGHTPSHLGDHVTSPDPGQIQSQRKSHIDIPHQNLNLIRRRNISQDHIRDQGPQESINDGWIYFFRIY
ncbi:hypothetical protein OS493_002514 [Desmophyllum pertusum]|uniref:RRM domain-containing protein n=1 Tax=Desmophyllum pertusum TaxID=174260 RepID=A0A9W9YT28_9CNID|nr:hypothetical protein OS493_002514 [Desmophyllum pertusum]